MEQKEKIVEAYKRGFAKVSDIDVSKMVEKKNGYNYLSWSMAWKEFCKIYPDATYEIIKNPDMNNIPVFGNEQLGYMVYTKVKVHDLEHEMWLPVMDGANMPMKFKSYQYTGWKWENKVKNAVTKTVEAMSIFDINKSTMRCLTKNLAMFGLGLNVYTGEDYPIDENDKPPRDVPAASAKQKQEEKKPFDRQKCIEFILKLVGEDVDRLNAKLEPYGIKGLGEASDIALGVIYDNLRIEEYRNRILKATGEDEEKLKKQLAYHKIEKLEDANINQLKLIHKYITGGK